MKLPKILCLQLNRFTLDYATFNRKKLNDKVSFPLVLNMNTFLNEDSLKDEATINSLIKDNPLNEVNPNIFAQNMKEEHQREL